MEIEPLKLKGVFSDKKRLFTKNLAPGIKVYDEQLIVYQGEEYRTWDYRKSKLAAAIKKGISQIGIKPQDHVLYLGASSGTTASHVSDIVGTEGFVYALDFSPRMTRDLVMVCKTRKNMAPLLANALQPQTYAGMVGLVDCIYQDVAQKDQVGIFFKNAELYLKPGGFGFLCIKARSIDVRKKPKIIFAEMRSLLERKMTVVDSKELDPYEKDHIVYVVKKQS